MDTKLCRICGKLGEDYVHIFKSEGLKNKIETCLPIIVSPHCLLPDTICGDCMENVDNFYSFIKSCLQNIIVLEAQYDIMESCLKTKRKHDKSCNVDPDPARHDVHVQTDVQPVDRYPSEVKKLDLALENAGKILRDACLLREARLVSYDVESDSEIECDDTAAPKKATRRNYFDQTDNDIIDEIAQRKSEKRKCERPYPRATKTFKAETTTATTTCSRRKNRQPKKVEYVPRPDDSPGYFTFDNLEQIYERLGEEGAARRNGFENVGGDQVPEEAIMILPQVCLLCEMQFSKASSLAAHVYETHGIDMAQVISSVPVMEKRKKMPDLVKIADLRDCNRPQSLYDHDDVAAAVATTTTTTREEEPATFVCPLCPAVLTDRTDLFVHLRVKHPVEASLACGICLHVAKTYVLLLQHLEACKQRREPPACDYTCRICLYSDDGGKAMENHVAVHDFVLAFCKREAKMYDPCDYIETNANHVATASKGPTCSECGQNGFESAKEFSAHRRSQHQIFHCDLCNKFYGRNSHLWKHVNRLHKGHPSITCQLCYKTSASKYHLAQHFNKIHSAKPSSSYRRRKSDDFMSQKFQGFDFQSVKQSFMRQEMLRAHSTTTDSSSKEESSEQESTRVDEEADDGDDDDDDEEKKKKRKTTTAIVAVSASPPKEIDASSNLYTNIITNYTPPRNEGEYKCPKCFKAFHKKPLLKKHKKNCRPRLQKDLLTRCKTCSRIFKDRQSLTKHLVNYHSEYTCEICGQKVQSKCEIVSHLRFSHPGCHLVCHCGNILRSRADLADHKKDHRNSFVCQFCADMLPTKIKLKMHILSLHRKILSLSCGICLKLFETQHILRDHVRLVHGDQLSPLTSCTVCGKNYGSKWKTYDHLNKSHGRIFKACKACLEVFDSEQDLQSHFDSSHVDRLPQQQQQVPVSSSSSCSVAARPLPAAAAAAPPPPPPAAAAAATVEKSDDSQDSTDYDNVNDKNDSDDLDESDNNEEQRYVNKISLLEQRLLLGQKRRANNDDDESNLHNPSQNSSKRTVYVNSNAPSVCEICMKTWPAKKHLWQHYIRCHKSVAATVCGICLQTNPDYESLQVHLRLTHPTLLHGQGFGSNFICRICGRYHNASSKLNLHMAIHENFDWSLLDRFPTVNGGDRTTINGYTDEPKPNDINYESMIEQVECSSDSNRSSSEEEDEDDDVDDDEEDEEEGGADECGESDSDDNSLESEMLQNMLREKYGTKDKSNKEEGKDSSCDSNEDSSDSNSGSDESSDDDDEEYDGAERHEQDDDENDIEQGFAGFPESWTERNIFLRKPEELDSAIRSISFETVETVDSTFVEEPFGDLQPQQSLNPHEIQTAVDSIL